jgi:hypothetical protein
MINHINFKQRTAILYYFRDSDILGTRLRVARGMIVRQDDF